MPMISTLNLHLSRNVRKRTWAQNENPNKPTHPRSLIRVFVVRLRKFCSIWAQWRFWSDCANAQADLNLRWSHMSDGYVFRLCSSFVRSMGVLCKNMHTYSDILTPYHTCAKMSSSLYFQLTCLKTTVLYMSGQQYWYWTDIAFYSVWSEHTLFDNPFVSIIGVNMVFYSMQWSEAETPDQTGWISCYPNMLLSYLTTRHTCSR